VCILEEEKSRELGRKEVNLEYKRVENGERENLRVSIHPFIHPYLIKMRE